MSFTMQIEMEGMEEVQKALNRMSKDIQEKGKAILQEAVFACAEEAKVLAPVDSGNLQNSITPKLADGGWSGIVTAGGKLGVTYAAYVEYGTRKMGAQPYMTPAFEKWGKWFIDESRKLIKNLKW